MLGGINPNHDDIFSYILCYSCLYIMVLPTNLYLDLRQRGILKQGPKRLHGIIALGVYHAYNNLLFNKTMLQQPDIQ